MFTCRQVLCWTFQYVQIKHVLWYLSKQGTEDFWNMPVHWRAGEHLEQFLKVTAVWSPCISCRVWLHRALPPDMRNCAGVGSGWYGGPYAAYAFRHSWAVYGQTNPYTAVLCNRHAGPEFPGCLPVPACQGPNYSREYCEYFAWLIHAAIERSDWLQQRICQTDKRQIFISFFPFLRTMGQVRLHPTIFAMPAMYRHGRPVAPQKFLVLVLNGLNIRKGRY